ncbi:MAG: CvpA family protein [Chloroflexota bacterium]
MNIADLLNSINLFDLLIILLLFGMFIVGFVQGTVRRVLGILSMLFAFFFAANVKDGLGSFLGSHWTQFPPQYGVMIGFLLVFVTGAVVLSLVIQTTYKKAPLFRRATFVDELIGGLLGVLLGVMILTFVTIILDSYFLLQLPPDTDELPFLRDLWNAISTSGSGALLHERIIPSLMMIAGFLIPETIRMFYQ